MGRGGDSGDMADWEERRASVGRRIKAAIDGAGITQTQLAEAIARGQSQVSRYIRGENLPEWDVVLPMSRALNVPAVDFLWPVLSDEPVDDLERCILAADINDDARRGLLTYYRAVRG